MTGTRSPRDGRGSVDAGFTLMEVVVALALLALVATASLVFFVKGTRAVTTQQRAQNAIAVANEAMEVAFSKVPTASATGTSGLVVGRTQSEVTAAWTAAVAAGVSGLSDSYPAWDTATSPLPATGIGDDAVPLTTTVNRSRIDYTVTTLVGACYRATASPAAPCTRTGGNAAGVAATGYARLMRSVVLVTWPDVSQTCGGTRCSYAATSLLDPSTDLEWNNTTRLLAADDAVSVNANATVTIDVLDNDTLMEITANPVSIVSQPVKAGTSTAMGTATVNPVDGRVTYTPSADAHGEVTFIYRITVAARTAQATVHAYVNPLARHYSVPGVVGTTVTVPIATVSGETPASLTIVSGPTTGTASVSGTSLRYLPTSAGTFSFTYSYTDAEGMVSLPGTVTATVTAFAPPTATTPPILPINAMATPTPVALNLQTGTGNPTTYQVEIATLPAGGTVQVDGANAAIGTRGAVATFTPVARTAGEYSFTFKILTPDGLLASAVLTQTIRVQPAAAADPSLSVKKSTTTNTAVGANDGSWEGTTFTVVSGLGSGCGTLTVDQSTWRTAGTVQYKAPSSTKPGCSFSYRLDPITAGLTASTTVTATIKVTNS